ncbi:MAG: hypothetical protein KGL04_02670 [Elusimicrobia bacterium]|nr:hypothetical protein [Elusimicrobiota bacterium]
MRAVRVRFLLSLPVLVFLSSAPALAARAPRGHKARTAAQSFNWLDLYQLSSYKEEWTATIRVDSLKTDLPKVLAAFKDQGAGLSFPLQNFASSKIAHTQQLSYRLSSAQAQAALDAVKKDGFLVLELNQAPASGNAPMPEVDAKIRALMSERAANRRALKRMPAVDALVNQMLDHLVMVKEVQERAQKVVVFNLTVSGKS